MSRARSRAGSTFSPNPADRRRFSAGPSLGEAGLGWAAHGLLKVVVSLSGQLTYDQLAAKSFDFSPSSIRDRWVAGSRDMTRAADWLASYTPSSQRFFYECP
jgi:hypothetical protein